MIGTRTPAADDRPPLTPSLLNVNEQLERIAEVAMVLLVGVMISTGYWSWTGLVIAAVLFFGDPSAVGGRGPGGSAGAARAAAHVGLVRHPRHRLFLLRDLRGNLGSDQILYAEAVQLLSCIFTVIAASIVVHGISAAPLMDLYQRRGMADRAAARASTVSDKR